MDHYVTNQEDFTSGLMWTDVNSGDKIYLNLGPIYIDTNNPVTICPPYGVTNITINATGTTIIHKSKPLTRLNKKHPLTNIFKN